jgi:iron complex outermembrane recepter protein
MTRRSLFVMKPNSNLFRRSAIFFLGLSVASVARGQLASSALETDAEIINLPELDVSAMRDSGYYSARSTAGLRTGAALVETPQSISVITAEQMRDQNAQNMQEALRYTAGVRAEMYGLDNRGDWFTLRGGSEGSTLLDGLRLPLTGWYGVVRNEPFAFDRVGVLRGPASVLAGQNGPGGVVNLVSKLPRAHPGGEINLQLGERNYWQIAGDVTGALDADATLLYRVVGLTRAADTQVEFADEKRDYFAPSLTWTITPNTTLSLYAQYQRDRSRNTEGFFPWAGTLFPAPNGFIPSDTFVSEPDWDEYGGRRTRFGYQVEQKFGRGWTLRHHGCHDRVSGKLRSMYANYWEVDADGNGYGSNALGDNRTIGRTWYATEDKGRITNGDLLVEGRFGIGGTRRRRHAARCVCACLRHVHTRGDFRRGDDHAHAAARCVRAGSGEAQRALGLHRRGATR